MNINSEYTNEEEYSPSEIMSLGMSYIWDNFIANEEKELTEEQIQMVAIIGASFRAIAEQANSIEAFENSIPEEESEFLRN
jgi:hypothetical protein